MVSDPPGKLGLLQTQADRIAHAAMRDLVMTSSTAVMEMPLSRFIEEVGMVQVETAKVPEGGFMNASPALDAVETLALALSRFQKVVRSVAAGAAVVAVGRWCLDGASTGIAGAVAMQTDSMLTCGRAWNA